MEVPAATVFIPILSTDCRRAIWMASHAYLRLLDSAQGFGQSGALLTVTNLSEQSDPVPIIQSLTRVLDELSATEPTDKVLQRTSRFEFQLLLAARELAVSVAEFRSAKVPRSICNRVINCLQRLIVARGYSPSDQVSQMANESKELRSQISDSYHFFFDVYHDSIHFAEMSFPTSLMQLAEEYHQYSSLKSLASLSSVLLDHHRDDYNLLAQHLVEELDHPPGCHVIDSIRGRCAGLLAFPSRHPHKFI